jgi:hypothetical protein
MNRPAALLIAGAAAIGIGGGALAALVTGDDSTEAERLCSEIRNQNEQISTARDAPEARQIVEDSGLVSRLPENWEPVEAECLSDYSRWVSYILGN